MATEYPDGIDDFTPITPGVPGVTTIRWIYLIRNTGTEMFRCMVI